MKDKNKNNFFCCKIMLEFLVDAPSFMKRGGAVQNIQEKLSASFTSGLDAAMLPINFSQIVLLDIFSVHLFIL